MLFINLKTMIQKKAKKYFECSSCKNHTVQWGGQCRACKKWNTIEEVVEEMKPIQIPRVSPKKSDEDKAIETEKRELLEKWFDFQTLKALLNPRPICENCGTSVLYQLKSTEVWVNRSTHAHIVPKSKFPSVATNKHNHLLMCSQCHSDYDNNWGKAKGMPIWEVAVKRARIFSHLISEIASKLPEDFFI